MSGQTPWQTTGPFLHFGLPWNGAADLTGDSDLGARPDLIAPGHDYAVLRAKTGRDRTQGQRIELVGRVWDNKDVPIIDSLIEILAGQCRRPLRASRRCATGCGA
jgi:protocatechuate 3,4-dioxygenase alpha subunit